MLHGQELAEWFAKESPLESTLEGFAPRLGQGEMAQAISDSILNGQSLIVEAGTGIGKTLAYLIPVLLSDHRVILSTGTKTLQDQLFYRDLPVVTDSIGRPSKTVLLKGRSNYLCLHRLDAAQNASLGAELAKDLNNIVSWSQRTRTGDIVEVDDLSEDSSIWQQVTSTQENCLGAKCDFYDQCYIVSARQAAMGAKIVVVNHHLLLADLLLKEEGFGELLPGADAVIIDEAHQFPEIAQGFFNVSFSSRSLVDLSRDLKTEAFSQIAFSKKLLPAAEKLNKLAQDVRLSLPNIGNNLLWSDIPKAFSKKLKSLILHLDFLIDQLQAVDESNLGLRSCYERICVLAERIEQIVSASDVDGLRWLGLTKRGFSLNFTPVDTSTELGSLLSNQICSWVFTSATLAVGDDFSHYQSRLGLKEINKLKIPSPFDYQDSGLLILPNDLPEPSEDIYTKRMLDKLLPLIMASKGRAFLLFTSYRALNQASKIIKKSKSWSFPLLVQGDSSRSKLLEQFIALSNPILLGTASFWEGVDIRGDGLVVVCIDRLPFTSPGDPMLKARLDAIARDGGQPFIDFQLPQAILALKQGVGRLIRDNKDYGVVVICDPRLTSKSYGRKFLQSLPPFPISNNIYDAVDFFYNKGSMDA